jgi:hypothetical protein
MTGVSFAVGVPEDGEWLMEDGGMISLDGLLNNTMAGSIRQSSGVDVKRLFNKSKNHHR